MFVYILWPEMEVYKSILELIGNTPLVEIRRLNPNPKVRILAKLESFNPGGSVKDRIALRMIEDAEASGQLHPGKVILEATSGNTGIGLALVGAVKGYKVLLVMPESVSEERKRILRAYGAEILLTPAEKGIDGAIEEAYRLAREDPERYFLVDQYNNPSNPLAHYYGTAEEIWRQTGGAIDAVVISIGTTGTLVGVGRRLKEYNPRIRVVAVEPTVGHRIQGLKNLTESYVPGIFDPSVMDEKIQVRDEDAFETARKLAREEGLLVGMSSGAAMYGALLLAQRMEKGTIVVILPDTGQRYLSTSLFVEKAALSLRLYNTLTRKVEPLYPEEPKKVRIYTCGPTASGPIHLGVWRRLVVVDVLKRYLRSKEIDVKHVVNITDIDDRTVRMAIEASRSLEDFTSTYVEEFFKEAEVLKLDLQAHFPRASRYIQEMVNAAEGLLKKGFAYERHRSLYFSLERFKGYGKLSGIDPNKLKPGRTDQDLYDKQHPQDFTLFKRSSLSELKAGIFYETPWGKARPSWHIECATMALLFLGDSIDLHTSSTDLIFPHNENEIAIAEALTGRPFVKHWLHVEQVLKDGEGMTYGTEGTVTLKELLEKGFKGVQVRHFLLSVHYRRPLRYSFRKLLEIQRAWFKLHDYLAQLVFSEDGPTHESLYEKSESFEEAFQKALEEDLNTPKAIAEVFVFLKSIQPFLIKGIAPEDRKRCLEAIKRANDVLQILEIPDGSIRVRVLGLLHRRREARLKRDFALADALRGELCALGFEVLDTPDGQVIRIARGISGL